MYLSKNLSIKLRTEHSYQGLLYSRFIQGVFDIDRTILGTLV